MKETKRESLLLYRTPLSHDFVLSSSFVSNAPILLMRCLFEIKHLNIISLLLLATNDHLSYHKLIDCMIVFCCFWRGQSSWRFPLLTERTWKMKNIYLNKFKNFKSNLTRLFYSSWTGLGRREMKFTKNVFFTWSIPGQGNCVLALLLSI